MDLIRDFYEGRRTEAVPFVVNDDVWILRGVHASRSGAIVGIGTSAPTPRFLVEFADGTDEFMSLDNLERIDDHKN